MNMLTDFSLSLSLSAPFPFYRYGVNPAKQAIDTSAGSIPILFDTNGNRLKKPEYRRTPLVVGPDGSQTTFFGIKIEDMFRFYGTSAAASTVAGIAGLFLEYTNNALSPCDVYEVLAETAIDMNDIGPASDFEDELGYDFGTGYGYVNASAAIEYVRDEFGNKNIRGPSRKTCPYTGPRYRKYGDDGKNNVGTALVAAFAVVTVLVIAAILVREIMNRQSEEGSNDRSMFNAASPREAEEDGAQSMEDEQSLSKAPSNPGGDKLNNTISDTGSSSDEADDENLGQKSSSFDLSIGTEDFNNVIGSTSGSRSGIGYSATNSSVGVSQTYSDSRSGYDDGEASRRSRGRYATPDTRDSHDDSPIDPVDCVAHADYDFETVYTPRHTPSTSSSSNRKSKRLDMTGNINYIKQNILSTLSGQSSVDENDILSTKVSI